MSVAFIISCSGRPRTVAEAPETEPDVVPVITAAAEMVRFKRPQIVDDVKLHGAIDVELELRSENRPPDSVAVFFDGRYVATLVPPQLECTVGGEVNTTTGGKSLRAIPYKNGRQQTSATFFVTVLSDSAPRRYGYRVVRTYPHDSRAFTQGLLFDGGVMYESTGQETESWLREVDIATGKAVRQHNLDPSLFGEGITMLGDRIFQVTWQNHAGFVYDKATFRQLSRFSYQTEGWGLATAADKIVMSDGSNVLSFHDPETFAVVSKIEVYDNEKEVTSLNELEYVDGEIWANIWFADEIARIDPVSGKVNGYIDLRNLYPATERNAEADVLNGIAYDAATKRIFVTGKKWDRMFEIVVTE